MKARDFARRRKFGGSLGKAVGGISMSLKSFLNRLACRLQRNGPGASVEKRPKARRAFFEPLEDRRLLAFDLGVINLSSLDGVNGFRLDGVNPEDIAGWSVSGAGDVNGDGFDDVIIGARQAGTIQRGASYIVFGKASGFAAGIDLATLDGSNGFRLDGANGGDWSGASVSGAGDVNGDGFDDLIVGAYHADPDGHASAGASYVVFGKASDFAAAMSLATLDGSNGFRLDGVNAGDRSGTQVRDAGDVNGDGFGDLIIGAPDADPEGRDRAGASYVVFGKASGFAPTMDLAALDGGNGYRLAGISPYDRLGSSVSGAGDVNGDGFGDLIVGAESAGSTHEGASFVVFGKASGTAANFDLATLDGSNGFRLDGIDTDDGAGVSVSGAGDFNGDGFDDLIIGAPGADLGGESLSGHSYVVLGKASGFNAVIGLGTLDGSDGFRVNGVHFRDFSGWSVSGAGDVNGDGFDDLLIGASRADPGDLDRAGESYVAYGRANPLPAAIALATLDGSNGFRLEGVDAGDNSGRRARAAGDVNGDGFDDLIIGAYWADPGGDSNAGEGYVVFGGDFTSSVTHAGIGGANTLTGDGTANVMVGGLGNDTLLGLGGADVLRGGEGDDILTVPDTGFARLVGGTGNDMLRLQGSGVTIDLTSVPNNRIVDVEAIDITGSGSNTLILDGLEVLNISSHSNTLTIRYDSDDEVRFGDGWRLDQPAFVNDEFRHILRHTLTVAKVEIVNASPWQNPLIHTDVNGDGLVTPVDVLQVFNSIDTDGSRRMLIPATVDEFPVSYFDVDGDNYVSPVDALVVINLLHRASFSEGESRREVSEPDKPPHVSLESAKQSGNEDGTLSTRPLAQAGSRLDSNVLPTDRVFARTTYLDFAPASIDLSEEFLLDQIRREDLRRSNAELCADLADLFAASR